MMAVLVGVLAIVACGIGGLAIWVLNVAADAPDIDTLRPANDGANSQIFDAAGNSLGKSDGTSNSESRTVPAGGKVKVYGYGGSTNSYSLTVN